MLGDGHCVTAVLHLVDLECNKVHARDGRLTCAEPGNRWSAPGTAVCICYKYIVHIAELERSTGHEHDVQVPLGTPTVYAGVQ